MLEDLNLDGKTIVITGGGTGLGREMALAIAKAGAHVVIASRRPGPIEDTVALVREIGRSATAISTDVTDSEQVTILFRRVFKELGHVDALFNNAGMVSGQGGIPIWDITDEDWRIGIDANLTGAFLCSRAVAKHMAERGEGKIINVSSGFGLRGGRDNYMYACSKGGIIQLTRTLAVSLGKYGVTSNCIVPGFFPTLATEHSGLNLPRDRFIPIGRAGDPAEIGPIAVFLASAASGYMNGGMFVADGGGLAGGYAPTGYAPDIPLELPS